MLRKNIRQRREYLFNLSKERETKDHFTKLQKVREATVNGTQVPTELYKEKEKLQKELKSHDANTISTSLSIQSPAPKSTMSTLIQSTPILNSSSPLRETPPTVSYSSPRNFPSFSPMRKGSTEEGTCLRIWLNLL
jgi:U3 small nucleolar ribonucleoprotein protein IMP4